MKCLVFLLEEPSAQDALEAWLPKIVPSDVSVRFIVFQGKQDLEKRMTLKIRHWLQPDSMFVVMRDQDSGDCRAIKTKLVANCAAAGRPDAVVRIACRELEAFFVGDWTAVGEAFQRPGLAKLSGTAKYRNPDLLGSPSEELERHVPGYQKREGARRIAPLMNFQRNTSGSFHALIDALQRLN